MLSVSALSVNRELSLISTVFTHAMKEWRLGLTFNPCTLVAKPRKARPRKQRRKLDASLALEADVQRLRSDGTLRSASLDLRQIAHRTARSAGGHRRIGLQC